MARDLEGTSQVDANLDCADLAMRRALAWNVNSASAVAWLRERNLNTEGHMLLLMLRGHAQGVTLPRGHGYHLLPVCRGPHY